MESRKPVMLAVAVDQLLGYGHFKVLLRCLQAICDVSLAQVSDVNKAVAAAKEAFEEGEWGKMNPRDRGRLIYKSVFVQLQLPSCF